MSTMNTEFKFVIDTSMFLAAVACSMKDGPDSNSDLDKQIRDPKANLGREPLDPQKVRGALIFMLLKGRMIVPKVVVEGLTGFLRSKKLSEQNKANLRLLLPHLQKLAIEITPTPADLVTQVQLFQKIATKSQDAITQMEKSGTDIPKNWETLSPQNLSSRDLTREPIDPQNPTKFQDRNQLAETLLRIHKNHHCKFWFKNHSFYPDIRQNISQESKNNPEHKPYLLADFSIFLAAQRNQAHIFTLDADFILVHQEIPTGPQIPKPFLNAQDMPKTVDQLIAALAHQTKKFRPSGQDI